MITLFLIYVSGELIVKSPMVSKEASLPGIRKKPYIIHIYIGETVRNLTVRIAEHSNPAHTSEPAKHLRENPSHSFTWRVLSSAQTFHKRRIVEGLMIQQFRPSLNKQVISYVSKLFPSGIT